LVLLADPDRPLEHREFIEECGRKAPDDRLVQLGLAAHAFWEGKSDEALTLLDKLLPAEPQLLSGHAMMGELLLDRGTAAFARWHAHLPSNASASPDVWFVRGLCARRHGELRVAVRCFWEAIRLAPSHRRATYHLGQVLTALGEEAGDVVGRKAEQLIRLTQALDNAVRAQFQSDNSFHEAADVLEQLGRVWEACAWALAAERRFPEAEWPAQVYARLAATLNEDLPLTLAEANLALALRFLTVPGPPPAFCRRCCRVWRALASGTGG